MKRVIITLVGLFLVNVLAFAQAPQKMSYQAVVRSADGNLVTNQNVGVRISVLEGSASGTASYVETHSVTSNENGLVTLEVGDGTATTGTFSAIDWSSANHFIKVETDPAGGTNYTIEGTSQLLTVPYAFHANSSTPQEFF